MMLRDVVSGIALIALSCVSAGAEAPKAPRLTTVEVRSMPWGLVRIVDVKQSELTTEFKCEGDSEIAVVPVFAPAFLKAMEEKLLNVTPLVPVEECQEQNQKLCELVSLKGRDYDFRVGVLLRYDDGSKHWLAFDRGCEVVGRDGVNHEFDKGLFDLVMSVLPEERRTEYHCAAEE